MVNFKNWFFKYNTWSYSKHRLFDLCKRNFYYRYIGTALKESTDFDTYKLKRLKDLNSKYALEGLLIHGVIENQIGQHYLGRDLNEGGAKSQFVQRVEQYRKTACDMITEFFNGLPKDDEFFDRIRAEGQDKISMFFGVIWPQLKDLEYLKHEDFDKFKINDVEVTVKVDYVSKTKNDIIVPTDWKTGQDNEEYESDLQIGTYVPLGDAILSENANTDSKWGLAYLKTGMMRQTEFNDEVLETIRKKIVDDFEQMNLNYEMNNYPASPEPGKCIQLVCLGLFARNIRLKII